MTSPSSSSWYDAAASRSAQAEMQAADYAASAHKFLDDWQIPREGRALVGVGHALLAIRSQLEALTAVAASGTSDVVEVLASMGAEVTTLTDLALTEPRTRSPRWRDRVRARLRGRCPDQGATPRASRELHEGSS